MYNEGESIKFGKEILKSKLEEDIQIVKYGRENLELEHEDYKEVIITMNI